jgi:hypothetical protein
MRILAISFNNPALRQIAQQQLAATPAHLGPASGVVPEAMRASCQKLDARR